MKKRLLPILVICFSILIFGGISVSAETYGDLTYTVSNWEVEIIDCAESATEVVIPKTINDCPVTSIGYRAFYNCTSLTSITMPNSVIRIGGLAFSGCSRLISVHITDLEKWCNICFEGLGANPLYCAENLYINGELAEDMTIPDGVTSIGDYTFSYCRSLTNVTIPDSVTNIGDDAFSYCRSLISITMPDSVTSIGDYAFYHCSSLTSIIIPENVTNIGYSTFEFCSSLTSITIPDSVTSICSSAFYNCSSLTNITIPDSVTSIGSSAFRNCSSLISINVDNNNLNYCSVEGVLFNKNKTKLVQYPQGSANTAYVIPDSVMSIGNYAFYYCNRLTSIIIPDSVTNIGSYAFYYCNRLTSIILENVTSIGSFAFSYCDCLTSITIPNNMTSIGSGTFFCCSSLTSITIPDGVTSIGNYAFFRCNSLTSITIPDSVMSIGDDAFSYCSSLTNITIPDSVTSIGNYAFYWCNSLTSITIPDSVTIIGEDAFYGCSSVENVHFSGSEEDWDTIIMGRGNDCLTNKDIITFGAVIQKIYTFITNGGSAVSDIEGEVSECPVTTRENYEFMGWYDNSEFSGNPITFPYSDKKTTLYAKWKPIIYTKSSLLAKTPDYDIYTIVPTNISVGSEIVFACYYKDGLTYVETRTYEGENPLYFVEHSIGEYDEVKIMVWESFDSLKPVCDLESVDNI